MAGRRHASGGAAPSVASISARGAGVCSRKDARRSGVSGRPGPAKLSAARASAPPMTRPAILLCLLAAAAASAEAREPVAVPWTEHPVLSLPTPLLAVSDRDTTDGGTTAEFFARLTDLGFACLAFEPPRRRIRRAEVVCTRGDGEDVVQLRGRLAQGRERLHRRSHPRRPRGLGGVAGRRAGGRPRARGARPRGAAAAGHDRAGHTGSLITRRAANVRVRVGTAAAAGR